MGGTGAPGALCFPCEGSDAEDPTMRTLTKLFLRGLAVVLPITLSLYLLWWLGTTTEALLRPLLARVLPGFYVPGLGLLAGIGVVIAIGALMRAWLVRELHRAVERLIRHIPLLKTIYGSLKDVMSFVTGGPPGGAASRVVEVALEGTDCALLGFLTREEAREITGRAGDERVAVYLPMSYQLGGFMVLVPRSSITPLEMTVEDAIGLTLTAGMSRGDDGGE